MKPKECAKYVYKSQGGVFCRHNGVMYIALGVEFPYVLQVLPVLKKLEFEHHGNPALAWKDKHGNIVIRVHHDNTQTKINF